MSAAQTRPARVDGDAAGLLHADRNDARLRLLLIVTLSVAGLLVSLAVNYPGFMTYDSVEQLLDARAGAYTDWHPPLMAALWRLTDRVIPGPFGMLLLQSALIWSGTALVMRAWFSRRASIAWSLLPVAVVLFPPVFSISGGIVKDVLMWAAFVLALGLAGTMRPYSAQSPSRFGLHLAATLLALGLAVMLRYNAVFAAIPILTLCTARALGPPNRRRLMIAAAFGFIGCAALVLAGARLSNAMAAYHRQPWISVAIFDISGIISHLHDRQEQQALYDRIPVRIRAPGGLDRLLATYPSYYWETPFAKNPQQAAFACPISDDTPRLHHLSRFDTCFFLNPEESSAIGHLWLRTIARHPLLWLYHRAQVFRHVLSSNDTHVWEPIFMSQPRGPTLTAADLSARIYGKHVPRLNRAQRAINDFFQQLANSWLYRPWIYFLLGLAVLAFAVRRWDWAYRDVILIAASGIAHDAGLFFLAPSADFRYSHFMIYASLLSAALLWRTEFVRRRVPQDAWQGRAAPAASRA
jgi:hypothetical protein